MISTHNEDLKWVFFISHFNRFALFLKKHWPRGAISCLSWLHFGCLCIPDLTCVCVLYFTTTYFVVSAFFVFVFFAVVLFTSPSLNVFRPRCTQKFCVFLLTSNADAELGCFWPRICAAWNSLLMSPGVSAPAVLVLQNKAIFWGFTPSICNASCLELGLWRTRYLACLFIK